MIRFGIIGTGFIAHQNVPALIRTGKAVVAAVCNRTQAKAEAFLVEHSLSCPVYTDYRAMCEEMDLDAVLIQSPHDLHEEQFLYCAGRGLDIAIEKPLATGSAECREMLAAKDRHGVRVAVGQTQRYGGAIMIAKAYMESHDTGPLVHVEDLINYHYFWDGRPAWALDKNRGGGITLNYAVHQIDRVQYLIGEETRTVFGKVEEQLPGIGVDTSFQMMGVTDSVSYTITCTGYANPFFSQMLLHFTKGTLRVTMTDSVPDPFGVFWGDTATPFTPLEAEYPPAGDYYLREMQAIVDYFAGDDNAPVVTPEYAAGVVRAVEALFESSETGRSVDLTSTL